MLTKFTFVFSFFCLIYGVLAKDKHSPKIGVIGGGISGVSASYFLRQLFGASTQIDLYEPEQKLGGRMALVELANKKYEAGGAIIHPKNMYMVNITKMLGLRPAEKPSDMKFAIYDGQDFVFMGSSYQAVTVLKLAWRYGWDIYNIDTYVGGMISNLLSIYETQESGHSFTKVENLFLSMAPYFEDLLHVSTKADLKQNGFSDRFIDELAYGGMRSNYGQGTDIHALVGAVSLAGIQPGLWSVKGGNRLVVERLAKKAKISIQEAKVTEVTLRSNKGKVTYHVEGHSLDGKDIFEEDYDIVVVATPLNDNISGIQFKNFPKPIGDYKQKFHRTVATFIKGWPNVTYFGLSHVDDFPDEIFTTNQNVFFNSIGKKHPVDYSSSKPEEKEHVPVYKVFSQNPLTKEEINLLFSSHEEIKVVDWLNAYPHYPSDQNDIPPFEIHDNLYYVNGIEIGTSCMEMGAIGGRNVANLAYSRWKNNNSKVDVKKAKITINKIEL